MRLLTALHLSFLTTFSPCFITPLPVVATLSNRTIDDKLGDSVTGEVPQFDAGSRSNQWSTNTEGCSPSDGCGTIDGVDGGQVFKGTWHSVMLEAGDPQPQNVTVVFSGIAVYVFNILLLETMTNLTFTIDDGDFTGQYLQEAHPNGGERYQYNVPVFSQTHLSNNPHTLIIRAETPSTDTTSSCLFDYVVYTFDDEQDPTSSPGLSTSATNTGSLTSNSGNGPTSSISKSSNSPSESSSNSSLGPSSSALPNSPSNIPTTSPLPHSTSAISSPTSPSRSISHSSPTSPSNPTSHSTPPNIVGISVGATVAVIATSIFVFLMYRRRRRASTRRCSVFQLDPHLSEKPVVTHKRRYSSTTGSSLQEISDNPPGDQMSSVLAVYSAPNILRTPTSPTNSQLSMHVPPRSDVPLGDSIGPTVVTASPAPVCNLRKGDNELAMYNLSQEIQETTEDAADRTGPLIAGMEPHLRELHGQADVPEGRVIAHETMHTASPHYNAELEQLRNEVRVLRRALVRDEWFDDQESLPSYRE